MDELNVLTGIIIGEETLFTLGELSRICGKSEAWMMTLVEEGVIEPVNKRHSHWQFSGHCLRRVKIAQRLETDLGLNMAGAALALELLEEIETLRRQISLLEQ